MKNKLQLLFIPFLLMGVLFILFSSFILWLLCIKWALFEVPLIVTGLLIPSVLLWILTSYLLEPRIDLLTFTYKKDWDRYFLMAAFLFVIPTWLSQSYLYQSTGEITPLANVRSIALQDKTKYYSLANYYVSTKDAGVYFMDEVRGKDKGHLDFSIFITAPLYNSVAEEDHLGTAWMGMKYTRSINNRLTDQEKQKAFEAFLVRSLKDFQSLRKPVYFDRIVPSEYSSFFYNALEKSPKYRPADHIILTPKYQPFQTRADSHLKGALLSFLAALVIWYWMLNSAELNEKRAKAFYRLRASKNNYIM